MPSTWADATQAVGSGVSGVSRQSHQSLYSPSLGQPSFNLYSAFASREQCTRYEV